MMMMIVVVMMMMININLHIYKKIKPYISHNHTILSVCDSCVYMATEMSKTQCGAHTHALYPQITKATEHWQLLVPVLLSAFQCVHLSFSTSIDNYEQSQDSTIPS